VRGRPLARGQALAQLACACARARAQPGPRRAAWDAPWR